MSLCGDDVARLVDQLAAATRRRPAIQRARRYLARLDARALPNAVARRRAVLGVGA